MPVQGPGGKGQESINCILNISADGQQSAVLLFGLKTLGEKYILN